MTVTLSDVLNWIARLQTIYHENRQYLTDLDAAIGDADHGINLDRGFCAVQTELVKTAPADISAALKVVAMTLIRSVGGASGPLYGTFFLRASAYTAARSELDASDVVEMFKVGIEGIQQRGKAEAGDKTMLDTLLPALAAMQSTLKENSNLSSILTAAAQAAQQGMAATVPLQAKKGRASYLGERSMGHQDPGATSAFWLIQAASELWRK